MTAAACAYGHARWTLVAAWGAGTARKTSVVTTPKLPAPAPRSAQNRSWSWWSSQPEDAAVGEHDLGPDEVVGGDAVLPSEDPEAAAQGQPRHPDRRAGAAGDRQVVVLQGLVDLAQPRACAHRGHALGDRHRPHRRDVDEHAPGRGVAREAVPAGAGRELQTVPASERDRLRDVLGAGAGHDGRRPDVTEPGVERRGRCLVDGRAGERDVPVDPAPQRRPVGQLGSHPAGTVTAWRLGCRSGGGVGGCLEPPAGRAEEPAAPSPLRFQQCRGGQRPSWV